MKFGFRKIGIENLDFASIFLHDKNINVTPYVGLIVSKVVFILVCTKNTGVRELLKPGFSSSYQLLAEAGLHIDLLQVSDIWLFH